MVIWATVIYIQVFVYSDSLFVFIPSRIYFYVTRVATLLVKSYSNFALRCYFFPVQSLAWDFKSNCIYFYSLMPFLIHVNAVLN